MRNYLHISLILVLLSSFTSLAQTFGFEDGTSNAWTDNRGMTVGVPEATVQGIGTMGAGAIEVTSAGTDAFLSSLGVNISSVSPNGGVHSLKMEDYQVGGRATQIEKTFTVTQQTALYVYHYAVILEDPGHAGRPFLRLK